MPILIYSADFQKLSTEGWYTNHTALPIRATCTGNRLPVYFTQARSFSIRLVYFSAQPAAANFAGSNRFRLFWPNASRTIPFYPWSCPAFSIQVVQLSFPRPYEVRNRNHPDSSCIDLFRLSACRPIERMRAGEQELHPAFLIEIAIGNSGHFHIAFFPISKLFVCAPTSECPGWMSAKFCPRSGSLAVMFENSRMERAVPWVGTLIHWWRYDCSEK